MIQILVKNIIFISMFNGAFYQFNEPGSTKVFMDFNIIIVNFSKSEVKLFDYTGDLVRTCQFDIYNNSLRIVDSNLTFMNSEGNNFKINVLGSDLNVNFSKLPTFKVDHDLLIQDRTDIMQLEEYLFYKYPLGAELFHLVPIESINETSFEYMHPFRKTRHSVKLD